jgi:hypothetical protein
MSFNLSAIKKEFGSRWIDNSAPALYDRCRRVFNGDINRRPYAIAYCASVEDIRLVLNTAIECNKKVTVRSTGHNVAGRGVANEAIVIDLSLMDRIMINAADRSAVVGAGATWKQYDGAAQKYRLATPGGTVSSTGVAGLTLGGGIGWLLPSLGLSCDSLRGVEVLGTDGQLRVLSDRVNPDLMRVFRGGGTALGVVTEFHFDLHPVERVIGGAICYRIEDAEEVLARISRLLPTIPDQLMVSPTLMWREDRPILELDIVDSGSGTAARTLLKALQDIGEIRADITSKTYVAMQQYLDNPKRQGLPTYWKTSFLARFEHPEIQILLDGIKYSRSPECMIILEHYHGKYRDPDIHRPAIFPHRGGVYNVIVIGAWEAGPSHDMTLTRRSECVRWSQEVVARLASAAGEEQYANYSSDDLQGTRGFSHLAQGIAQARVTLDPAELIVI